MGKYFIYSTDVLYAKNVKNQVIKSNPPNMRKKMGLKKKKKKKKKPTFYKYHLQRKMLLCQFGLKEPK
jgi:hypothetical protein